MTQTCQLGTCQNTHSQKVKIGGGSTHPTMPMTGPGAPLISPPIPISLLQSNLSGPTPLRANTLGRGVQVLLKTSLGKGCGRPCARTRVVSRASRSTAGQLRSHEEAASHGDGPELEAGGSTEAALDAANHPRHGDVPKALQRKRISRILLNDAPAGTCIPWATLQQVYSLASTCNKAAWQEQEIHPARSFSGAARGRARAYLCPG